MKKLFFLVGSLCLYGIAQGQSTPVSEREKDTTEVVSLEEVMVQAVRVKKSSPVTFSNVTKEQIKTRNLGQDIPIMLNYLPNVVTTSDAGAGVGYTGIRVRGIDAYRVNVTINGIPYNDAESQGTFWVNMPDFVSSVESLQLQRGLGTSTNGAGAFGASLNLLTDNASERAFAQISNSYGSFNTRKHTIKLGTGKFKKYFEVSGRVSKIASDGYIERASSDLKSYFLQGSYTDNNTIIKALSFGGKEKTYQAWDGIDKDKLKKNRRYNPSGVYTDKSGKEHIYDNHTDNYWQYHYQLHWNQKYSQNWSSHLALHYTRGKGYYESIKDDKKYSKYFLPAVLDNGKEVKRDFIEQKWLDNHFYGGVFSFNYEDENWDFIFGGGTNHYIGGHYGYVLWTEEPVGIPKNYKHYDNGDSKKLDGNVYAKVTYKLNSNWRLFGDLQYRRVDYQMFMSEKKGQNKEVSEVFNFFNPKAGITYSANSNNNFYFSYARGHREPSRKDYKENDVMPKPEELNDFELGWRFLSNSLKINTNVYYMLYRNQLVLTGKLNDVGSAIRTNSGKSYRLGLEVDAVWYMSEKWQLRPNFTISSNKNIDFHKALSNGKSESVGNTTISYSPDIVAGNILTYSPISNLQFSILSKYVGKQYMSNLNEEESELKDYFVNDINIGWQIYPKKVFKSVELSVLVNNVLDREYVSYGWYDSYSGANYYPQAGINFLGGLTLNF